MKLALVSDYGYPTGGIEQFVYELLDRLPADIQQTVLSWTSSVLVPPRVNVVTVEFGDVRSIWDTLDQSEIVLVATSFNIRLLAHSASEFLRRNSKPTIVIVQTSAHSDPAALSIPSQDAWLRELLSLATAVVAVSEEVETSLVDRYGLKKSKIRVIENAARDLPIEQRQSTSGIQISFIGRPHPQKGYELFVRLAEEIRKPGVKFAANTVSVLPRFKSQLITYSSNLTDVELAKFFADTDLLVAPYLRADGLPLALLEALNCGVPTIGFNSNGVAGLLHRHGQCVVEPTYDALARAVHSWLDGNLDLKRPRLGSVPNWDQRCTEYLDLIEAVCGDSTAEFR